MEGRPRATQGRIDIQTVEEVLLTAIAIERYGQEYYRKFASTIPDRKGESLMNGLAKDEKEHEDTISKEYQARFRKAPPKKIDVGIGAKAIKEIFAAKKGKSETEITLDILQVGIVVEQKSVDFYSSNAKRVKDAKLKKMLDQLVDIEEGHKALLEENLFHLRQDGTWWGYVPILEG